MANYLVTGGAGFIGSHLVEHLLERGESVRVIDNLVTGKKENVAHLLDRIEFIEGDLRELADCNRAVADMDFVLHQAAVPSVPRSLENPLLSHETNVTGTLNLLLASRDAKISRLVFASSSSVYGELDAAVKSETLPCSPLSPYAAGKAACEHYLRAFSACFGIETVSLRYFNVFGPRQDPNSTYSAVIPLFIGAALRRMRPIVHGDGGQVRDFTYVENNVRANVLAATGAFEARGQVYNVACGSTHSVLDLLGDINALLGSNLQPVYVEARTGDVRVSQADISKARDELNYEVGVPFREGLERTIEWFRAQYKL